MIVRIPWPHRDLSPNSRVHWAPLAHQKKIARICARYLALEAGAKKRTFPEIPKVVITFHPPDARTRDSDNMIAAGKASFDGIADAIGVDDGKWSVTYATGVRVKGGQVVVEVEEA